MAKAIFEPGQKESALAGGIGAGFNQATNPIPEGNPDPDRSMTSKEAKANNPLHLSGRRQLFYEDLSKAARGRLDVKHQQFQHDLAKEVTKPATQPGPTQRAAAAVMSSRGETLDQASSRIASENYFWSQHPEVRHEGDLPMPGAGWYIRHNAHYRAAHPGVDNASDTGSVMSPLNSPANERKATAGLLAVKGRSITITPDMAAGARKALKSDEVVPDTQVGTAVRSTDLHPKMVKWLTLDSTAASHPDEVNSWSSPEERKMIKAGGTNVPSGVRVQYKGETLKDVSNPQSSPKVFNYGTANRNFNPSPRASGMYLKRAADVEEPRDGMIPMNDSQVFKMTPQLADHALTLLGKGTPDFDPQDRAVQEIVANTGKHMHMDFAHPAIVQAMADLGVKRRHPKVHAQALASMNHPTVQDSWMNANVAGQPQATVLPTNAKGERTLRAPLSETSVHKEGGVYWPNMSITHEDGTTEDILDVSDKTVYAGGPAGLQHASGDYITRRSARKRNVPSVAAQESDWTVIRRVAGRTD